MGEGAEFNSIAVGPSYWAGDMWTTLPALMLHLPLSFDLEESSVLFHPQVLYIERTLKELLTFLPFPSL